MVRDLAGASAIGVTVGLALRQARLTYATEALVAVAAVTVLAWMWWRFVMWR